MNSIEDLNHCEVLMCFSFLETHHLLDQKRYNQDQLFLYAFECENLKAAAQFFPERDINSVVNEEKENAFMLACLTGNITLVKWLVEKQINVHALNKWGESALFYATKSNNFNLVK